MVIVLQGPKICNITRLGTPGYFDWHFRLLVLTIVIYEVCTLPCVGLNIHLTMGYITVIILTISPHHIQIGSFNRNYLILLVRTNFAWLVQCFCWFQENCSEIMILHWRRRKMLFYCPDQIRPTRVTSQSQARHHSTLCSPVMFGLLFVPNWVVRLRSRDIELLLAQLGAPCSPDLHE